MSTVTDIQDHDWVQRPTTETYMVDDKVVARRIFVCKHCGNVKRADGKNSPCRGKVYIRTR
jgi:predicted metal-binding protein